MSKSPITPEVLTDIAFRARLELSSEHYQDYERSFKKIVTMLESISQVAVCAYKGYTHEPIPCDQLREDVVYSDMSEEKRVLACPHYNPHTQIIEVPKVISEGD